MRLNTAWLSAWVDFPWSAEELGAKLTMAGLELDALEPAAARFQGVVVGRIQRVEPHPEADALKVCRVEAGTDSPLQVVCGAANARSGMLAPVATVGARLPADVIVEATEIRGIASRGMLCSERELGLSDSTAGLMELAGGLHPGDSLWDVLVLDDTVLEFDLTPERADCLSILGIAREVAALMGRALPATSPSRIAPGSQRRLPVEIDAPAACPRYAGRIIEGVDAAAPTPMWMRERLRRCGLRSLGAVVDVTNYVMLELGQPLHAFDLARLAGGIRVRAAAEGETLALLDGQTVTLQAGALVIADHSRALALAGIMGGEDSAVGLATRDIFLESAYFTPRELAGRARQYGLHTDSSHRFERGVDAELQVEALERATALLMEIAGGQPGPVTEVRAEAYLHKHPPITLQLGHINRLLGIELAAETVVGYLKALQCKVETDSDGWRVTPPGFRFDLEQEADLIEEVARLYGYDRIPLSAPAFHPGIVDYAPEPRDGLRDVLVERGYQEAITYSFVDPEWERHFNPEQTPRALSNPISSELAVMRSSLWPGLVKAAQYNLNRQQSRVRLFETGLRFVVEDDQLAQTEVLAAVVTGPVSPEQWGAPTTHVDFFDIKGDVEALLARAGLAESVAFHPLHHAALHPGQAADIRYDNQQVGRLGALHPAIAAALGVDARLYLFELMLAPLGHAAPAHFRALSRYPAIRRDIALVVDHQVTAGAVRRCIAALRVEQLQETRLFDVYTGKGVAKGRKSLALGLILQDFSRTLNDEEVDGIVTGIVTALRDELGASLRD